MCNQADGSWKFNWQLCTKKPPISSGGKQTCVLFLPEETKQISSVIEGKGLEARDVLHEENMSEHSIKRVIVESSTGAILMEEKIEKVTLRGLSELVRWFDSGEDGKFTVKTEKFNRVDHKSYQYNLGKTKTQDETSTVNVYGNKAIGVQNNYYITPSSPAPSSGGGEICSQSDPSRQANATPINLPNAACLDNAPKDFENSQKTSTPASHIPLATLTSPIPFPNQEDLSDEYLTPPTSNDSSPKRESRNNGKVCINDPDASKENIDASLSNLDSGYGSIVKTQLGPVSPYSPTKITGPLSNLTINDALASDHHENAMASPKSGCFSVPATPRKDCTIPLFNTPSMGKHRHFSSGDLGAEERKGKKKAKGCSAKRAIWRY